MTQLHAPEIPQTSPRAAYLAHREEIDAATARALDSGWYILGGEVAAFEREFADYIGVSEGIGVGSGTDALELALKGCGVGDGDLVFTVSHTAVATVCAIEETGATPVLVDIDPASFTIDCDQLEDAIRSAPAGRPRAIVPVHLYGHPADMSRIMAIADDHGLDVIEDCAQSHGAMLEGKRTGTFGRAAAFSFYPTKNLAAMGDGGFVGTSDPEVAARVRLLQQYGWKERYISEIRGGNSRLDEIHAAMLRVKLRYLDEDNRRRNEIARLYDSLLADSELTLPSRGAAADHVYHQYAVLAGSRESFRGRLKERGIGTLVHYPVPVHMQPAYASRVPVHRALGESERIASQVVSLPMFPQLADDDVRRVASEILELRHRKARS